MLHKILIKLVFYLKIRKTLPCDFDDCFRGEIVRSRKKFLVGLKIFVVFNDSKYWGASRLTGERFYTR